MIYRSKAPLRLGLAGGGTDVSPYSDEFGGAILNATISLYAAASIEPTTENGIVIEALDRKELQRFTELTELPINGTLDLAKGVYNRIQKDYGIAANNFRLSTFVDAPAGSGLGTSSTLVVAIIGAFVEMLNLPLGDYDIAHYAFDIERNDLGLAGGKQDQYAATFGGVNFIEEMYSAAKKAGATGGKISGAGGGGFMTFYCPNNSRYKVIDVLNSFGGDIRPYQFTQQGLTTWTTI